MLKSEKSSEREQLRRLFLVKRTELEMVRDRGFSIDSVSVLSGNESWINVDLSFMLDPVLGMDKFADQPFFQEMLLFQRRTGLFQKRVYFTSIYQKPLTGETAVVVYLQNDPGKKVSTKYFKAVNKFIVNNYRNIIIITETGLNSDLTGSVQTRMPSCKIDIFLDSELSFNRLKHAYAPIKTRYILASEAAEWKEEEDVDPKRLPLILENDILSRWYGARSKDVFQTELLGVTTDTIGYYRAVRKTPAKN